MAVIQSAGVTLRSWLQRSRRNLWLSEEKVAGASLSAQILTGTARPPDMTVWKAWPINGCVSGEYNRVHKEEQENVMRKSANGVRGPRTLGELVTLAFDVSPNRAAAVKLVGQLIRGGAVHFGGSMSSGS